MNRRKLMLWIENHLPVWCFVCGYVMFTKSARYRYNMVARKNVPLCRSCFHEIYTPFEVEEVDE
jgi:hypothetical protein